VCTGTGRGVSRQEETGVKRFHIHVSVHDLSRSIRFHSTLFGAQPSRVEVHYAKWMLEDPRINFAISTGRQPVGVNHPGFQVDSGDELQGMRARLWPDRGGCRQIVLCPGSGERGAPETQLDH
jgi:hypothetical protein